MTVQELTLSSKETRIGISSTLKKMKGIRSPSTAIQGFFGTEGKKYSDSGDLDNWAFCSRGRSYGTYKRNIEEVIPPPLYCLNSPFHIPPCRLALNVNIVS